MNAWLLYTRSEGASATISLAEFKYDVAAGLITAESRAASSRTVPVQANVDGRYDRTDHFPNLTDVKNAQRCKGDECFRRTKYRYRKCLIYLCIDHSDCFYKYHVRDI